MRKTSAIAIVGSSTVVIGVVFYLFSTAGAGAKTTALPKNAGDFQHTLESDKLLHQRLNTHNGVNRKYAPQNVNDAIDE